MPEQKGYNNEDDLYDHKYNSREKRQRPPTQKQIRKRCLEIQKTWDEETKLSRLVDQRLRPDYLFHWEPPLIKMEDIDTDVESCLGDVTDMGIKDELLPWFLEEE